jgi:hypothetical protein
MQFRLDRSLSEENVWQLKNYDTSRKVADSIPVEVIGFFN